MGLFSSTEFKDTHILHCTKFCDNKLYVYMPMRDKFYSFSIFHRDQKFRFFAQESISISSGSIYIVGGQTVEDEYFLRGGETAPTSLSTTNFVAKINLRKHRKFHIELTKMKPCKVLPEPRTSHLMIHCAPYIFVIGGYLERNISTRSCLRFHTKRKTWERIADVGFATSLTEPCGIALNGFLYVFDTAVKSDLPRIHQYSIAHDSWVEILIQQKNRGISIPPSINCSVYQVSANQLMIIGGLTTGDAPKGFYYTFNIETEELSNIIIEETLGYWKKEKQGNLNYVNSESIYVRLGERSVRKYRRKDKRWMEIELEPENDTSSDGFGCCSRNR